MPTLASLASQNHDDDATSLAMGLSVVEVRHSPERAALINRARSGRTYWVPLDVIEAAAAFPDDGTGFAGAYRSLARRARRMLAESAG